MSYFFFGEGSHRGFQGLGGAGGRAAGERRGGDHPPKGLGRSWRGTYTYTCTTYYVCILITLKYIFIYNIYVYSIYN